MKKLVFLALCLYCVAATAQDVVSLVVSADGPTKTQAIDNALRSAIEQTYGTFVSANTQILNDELVKDEIATVSSGNIQKYKEVAVVNLPNGNTSVSLNVTVSLKKLVKYAQSKGAECEFAGATFGANARLYEFNKRNEQLAIQNMIKQLDALRPIYDYDIEVSEPIMNKGNQTADIKIQVTVKANDKTKIFNEIFENTIMSLAMTKKQIKPMLDAGFEYKPYLLYLDGKINKVSVAPYWGGQRVLPNNLFYFYTEEINNLDDFINNVMFDFSITDNQGNEFLIFDQKENGIISIGHRILLSHGRVKWGFEREKDKKNNFGLTKWYSDPTFNTHTNWFNGVQTGRADYMYASKIPLLAINTSKIVWIFPYISFSVPVENINNISKITINSTKDYATNFLFSYMNRGANRFVRSLSAKEEYKGFVYTKYNPISNEQSLIKKIKELRKKETGAIEQINEK